MRFIISKCFSNFFGLAHLPVNSHRYFLCFFKFILLTVGLCCASHAFALSGKYKAQKKLSLMIPPSQHYQTLDFVDSIEEQMVNFIHEMVAKVRYSTYKLGGTLFDTRRGIYVLDCSTYVDHILKTIHPLGYFRLVSWSRSDKPTTYDYYRFFTSLGAAKERYWHLIENVSQLRPGDILVFRKKNKGPETSGHIMIVMDKPVREKNILKLRIADSAPVRHSHDTRPRNVSGIGIGTLLLKLNPKTFQPFAYAWQADSPWKQNVKFAMARPNIPS